MRRSAALLDARAQARHARRAHVLPSRHDRALPRPGRRSAALVPGGTEDQPVLLADLEPGRAEAGTVKRHLHVHSHEKGERARTRSPRSAFAIGLVHGMGGSAGVGVLLVASIESTVYGVIALGLLAAFTAVSMTLLSTGLGAGLTRLPLVRLAPALGTVSLAFGVWYALGALSLAPCYF